MLAHEKELNSAFEYVKIFKKGVVETTKNALERVKLGRFSWKKISKIAILAQAPTTIKQTMVS